MGLTFLAPLFLAGALALAVPIIVHLVHRQRPDGIPFPSLMFLHQIPVRAERRQRIRHWALFLLRCVALALLAIAFARPLLTGVGQAATITDGGREVVMLLDRSLSMQYGDRWSRALDAANRAISGLGPQDRASIVVFDEKAIALTQPTADRVALTAALQTAKVGHGRTRYAAPLRLAETFIEQSDLPRREVLVISDFQRSGWDAQDVRRFPSGVTVTPIDVGDDGTSNLVVSAVSVRHQTETVRSQFRASARVVNAGSTRVASVPISLELNGQVLQRQQVSVEPNDAMTVTFGPALVPDGLARAIVRLGEDGLVADNAFHFVIAAGGEVGVLVLEGSSPRHNQSLYLARAREVGDAPPFAVRVVRSRTLRNDDLNGRSIVVLNDVPFPGGAAGNRLAAFVEAGGGLLVVGGDAGAGRWPAEAAALLPGTVSGRVEHELQRGGAVTEIDYGHPVFEIFSAPRSGDLTAARFFRYWRLDVGPEARVVARFDDGAVALAERRYGSGRVLVWTSTLDTYWNNFGLQPVFVPFVHEMAKYLADFVQGRMWFTVGSVADLAAYARAVPSGAEVQRAIAEGGELILDAPSSERHRLQTSEASLFEVREMGFYEIKTDAGEPARMVLAVNPDPSESDLSRVDIEEFAAAVSAGGQETNSASATLVLTPEQQEQRQGVWWYLLIGALALLTAETVVSNRLSRSAH